MDDLLNGNLVINSFAQTKLVAASVVRITLYLTVTLNSMRTRFPRRRVSRLNIKLRAIRPLTKFAGKQREEAARTRSRGNERLRGIPAYIFFIRDKLAIRVASFPLAGSSVRLIDR
jgi:hypothetical protein